MSLRKIMAIIIFGFFVKKFAIILKFSSTKKV